MVRCALLFVPILYSRRGGTLFPYNGPMRKGLGLLAAVLLFSSTLAGAGEREARYLSFTAKNKNKIYLRDVKIEEVKLFLDNQPAKVSYLGNKNVESAFVFLMENSPRTAQHPASMPQWGKINKIDQVRYQLAGDYFLQLVKSGEVLLAEFSREVRLLQDFTNDDLVLEDAVNRMQPNFSEIFNDDVSVSKAFAFGIQRLQKRQDRRKVMVLITTTVDRDSYRNMQEYQEVLRAADIEFYVVSFAPRIPPSVSSFEEKMNSFYFKNLVGETAGKLYLSGEYAFISEFMDDLRTRLENTYTMGFYVERQKEPAEHEVRMEVRDSKVEVTHRKKVVY